MARLRILSLDGGGSGATFTASVLTQLEELSGKRLADHFDLITGTSTGGIIAIGLGLGITPREILAFYEEKSAALYPRGFRRALRRISFREALERSLSPILADRLLGESSRRLVIPALDRNSGNAQLFKTAHQPHFVRDHQLRALDVALATAAAEACGPWASCPVVVGLLEAIFVLRTPPSEIDLLSIGTTQAPLDQIDGALAQARLVTGDHLLRIDARPSGRGRLRPEELRDLGASCAREHAAAVTDVFLGTPAPPFRPGHARDAVSRGKVARRRRRRSLGIAQTGPLHGHKIVDISVSGALLETTGEIAVGTPIDLDLYLDGGVAARVAARVVRLQQPAWGRVGGIGVEFTEYQEGSRAAIERYVRTGPEEESFLDTRPFRHDVN
jgi:hypothetical protein